MAIGHVLFNLNAGHGTKLEDIKPGELMPDAELQLTDITGITDYREFFAGLAADDYVVLCGGDGTLNRFINATEGLGYENEILYYPCGTGNDFAAELGYSKGCKPFRVNEYLKDLPFVTVKGNRYRFLNGVGYGIDGYCCEVGDQMKAASDKPVNYTSIAIKGLLFHYKPTNAKITVDGVTKEYKKVWLAPTMNGKFYGGGMMPTPYQNRKDPEKKVSCMVYYGKGKLKSLIVFPSIFKGEHLKHKEMIEVLTGNDITVEFDRPVALQIDGETILDVTSYTVNSAKETVTV